MGFSPTVKQQAMIASARHCCVCHKYKGVKIEVHHIDQEADGGPNTFENAIPLCFDCHSDAGHFNNRHPKGTKFSKVELIKARYLWYEFVKKNPIVEKLIVSDKIQASYYVVHSFELLTEVLNNDLSSINKYRKNVYLKDNEVSTEWKGLIEAHKSDTPIMVDQRLIIKRNLFTSIEEYSRVYGNIDLIDPAGTDYPSYSAKRKVSWQEMLNLPVPNKFLNAISRSGIEPSEFCVSLLYENGESCGGEPPVGYTEIIEIAPISFVFLGISNVSNEPLTLNSLLTTTDEKIKLPSFNVLPLEMVLFPISTVINLREIAHDGDVLHHSGLERGKDFSRILNSDSSKIKNVRFFDNKIDPKSIIFNDNEGEYEVEIHDFDCTNLYSINSYWQIGSCPHLFFINEFGRQEYQREILASSAFVNGTDTFNIPEKVDQIVIRELEDEVTYLDKILVNGKRVVEFHTLSKGESLIVRVSSGDIVKIEGRYEPFHKAESQPNDFWYRNKLIENSNAIQNFFK